MARIAENTVIVDGQEYKPGDVIPDFKSIKCVDTREPRKYQGLSADVSVLNDVIAKYASGGASCFMSDTGEYYEYDRKEKAWKLITNITERGFDSEKAYGALKHMLKNVTVSDEKIQSAVTNYLTVNPVLPGATTEQAQQIEQNRTDVASLKKETGSLKEDISNKITKFYASNQGETHLADSDDGKIMDMMIYGKSSQDGTPSPDYPQEIRSVVNPTVKVVGKNLLNSTLQTITRNGITCTANGDGTYTLNGTATSETDFYLIGEYNNLFKIALNPEKEYIYKGTQDAKIKMYIGSANNTVQSVDGKSIQIKNMSGIAFVIIRVKSGSIINNVTVYPQLEEGSVSTAFEPYHEQTVTLPYTLNAIPVSSGGNVTINGQQYVSDYIDVERGKVVRCVKREPLSKNGRLSSSSSSSPFYTYNLPSAKPKTISEVFALCNLAQFNSITTSNSQIGISSDGSNNLRIRLDGYTTLEQYTRLSAEIIYELATPIEEDLTSEQIQSLQALKTKYPVTNIFITSDQLDGYTTFNYPISMANGWNYVKQQIGDTRDYIYDMDARTQDTDLQAAEAYVNSEYAVALTELEV